MAPLKFELEIELKSPPDALWNTVKDINILYPKLIPDIFKNVEILHGDGRSTGTIRNITFPDDKYGMEKTQKSKIEYVDEENKAIGYLVLEGRPMQVHKYYHESTTLKPNGKGTVVFWTCTYEKKVKQFPGPSTSKDLILQVFHKLDAYTLSNINDDNNNNNESKTDKV